jgi:hypothetical protein
MSVGNHEWARFIRCDIRRGSVVRQNREASRRSPLLADPALDSQSYLV